MTIMVSANHSYWQPGGCIATGAAQQRQQNACERRLNGCRQMVMHVAGAQHPSQMFFWLGVDFWSGRKIHKLGWDRLKLGPRTIAELGEANVEYNVNLTSPLRLKDCLSLKNASRNGDVSLKNQNFLD